MSSRNDTSGCLFGIICFVFLIGNLFLLSDDSEWQDEALLRMMVAIAIIMDIAIVVYIIYTCVQIPKKKLEAKQRQQEEQERREKQRKLQVAERKKQEVLKEKQRISKLTQKINRLILKPAKQPYIESSLVNKEVVFTVNQYKDNLRHSLSECNEHYQAIENILFCEGCTDVNDKFNHLSLKNEEFENLKSKIDLLHSEINGSKIKLLNENDELLLLVKNAFTSVFSSKKCILDGRNLEEFICKKKLFDLKIFNYKYLPAVLHMGEYFYCLFSNVILVFDKSGVFMTAVDPTALSIEVERVCVDVKVRNNTLPSRKYIDTDSKCIKQGETKGETIRTWLYTRQDGSPDLRYKNNPSSEYRMDKYEYGRISISILGNTVSLSLSSDKAVSAFEKMSKEYIRKCNNRHNPIPELLDLFFRVSEKDEPNIAHILNVNRSNSEGVNYFCVID